jgi:Zn ribbon nucleic-acid-binding protein
MEKTVRGGYFDAGRYGMSCCPVCKGSGKLFIGVEKGVVCKACGGFGFIKKEKDNHFNHHRFDP